MPTYEYVCRACGAETEFFQPITANPKRKCPTCSALKLKRRISAGAGLLFRGNGFYTTDYRSASYKAGERADKKIETDSKTTKSSDNKDHKKD